MTIDFPPLAKITRNGRKDYVFLRRQDLEQDYPTDSTVEVFGAGGVILATKTQGAKKLAIAHELVIGAHFKEVKSDGR
jgi:hypothetical protein